MELINVTLPTGAKVTAWLHSQSQALNGEVCGRRPLVVVCPGGGYIHVSDREKDPVAREFFSMGAQVLTLEYTVGEKAGNKRPLEELARSILLARQNADAWRLDPDRIAVIGFSAGGHLAASLGVHWDDPEIAARLGVEDARLLRPNALILCYPVITAREGLCHAGSIQMVSAGTQEAPDYWSLETQVKETTPTAFLWHTMDDAGVPVENSLLFVSALRSHGISCEAHFFPHGTHGISVATKEVGTFYPAIRPWVGLCRTWLENTLGPLPG